MFRSCWRAGSFLRTLGGELPRSFLLLAQKKRTKEKCPRRLAPRWRKGCPALLGQNRRCGTHHAAHGSDSPRFSRFCPVMLGGVNETGVPVADYRVPLPLVQPSTAAGKRTSARTVRPSKAREFRSARFLARSTGESERSADQAVGCRFFCLLFFGQTKKRRSSARRRAHQNPSPRTNAIKPRY